jgi:chromosome segregation ATPase
MTKRIVIVATTVVALAVGVTAQQAVPTDPIQELLVEVRGLRAALERSASVGARVQVLVARMQMQEQRVAELSRRAMQVRGERRTVEQQLESMLSTTKQFEHVATNFPPEQRDEFQQQMVMMKSELGGLEKRRIDLTQEESLIEQQLAEDQGRWTAINDQLDALERSLAIRP